MVTIATTLRSLTIITITLMNVATGEWSGEVFKSLVITPNCEYNQTLNCALTKKTSIILIHKLSKVVTAHIVIAVTTQ